MGETKPENSCPGLFIGDSGSAHGGGANARKGGPVPAGGQTKEFPARYAV